MWAAALSKEKKTTLSPGPRSLLDHHAAFAKNPLGHLRTANFRPSSSSKRPTPKAMGKNQCSTGTGVVANTVCRGGMYSQKKAMTSENKMAGKR